MSRERVQHGGRPRDGHTRRLMGGVARMSAADKLVREADDWRAVGAAAGGAQ